MRRWSRHPVAWTCLALAGLLVLAAVVEHARGRVALARYEARLGQQGEKLTVAEISPRPPTPEQAQAVRDLVRLMPRAFVTIPPAMQFVAPGRAMVAWQQPAFRRAGAPTNTWGDIAAEVEGNRTALEQVRRLLAVPGVRYDLDYTQGAAMRLPHLPPVKNLAQHASASALLALHEHRLDDALQAVQDLGATLRLIEGDQLLISELVRLAIGHIASNVTWELLQADGWTDAQLASLQTLWAGIAVEASLARALETERAFAIDLYAGLRRSGEQTELLLRNFGMYDPAPIAYPQYVDWIVESVRALLGDQPSIGFRFIYLPLWRFCWSRHDELRYLQRMQALVEEARQMHDGTATWGEPATARNRRRSAPGNGPAGVAASTTPERLGRYDRMRFLLSDALGSARDGAILRVTTFEAWRQMALTSIALKRYHLRHQQLPETLAALVPDLISAVPRDPMDGQPLRYRRLPEGGCLLYSVAENLKDDGGDATIASEQQSLRSWRGGRDWVWPRPATPAEIAAKSPLAP